MSTKPVKKLKDSSGNNALIKVDIAVRDSQGRVIKDTYAEKSEIPTRLPAQGGNADYATNSGKVNNHTVESDVPANAVFTDTWPTTYATGASKSGHTLTITLNTGGSVSFTDTTYSNATQSAAGLMSSADKTKLDGLNGSNYLAKAGGTMTGHLKWNDSSALPSTTAAGLANGLQFILGIKAFSDGGDTVYETRASLLSGLIRFDEAQSLTDAQKTQARSNIGVVQKYRHHCTFEWSGGSGSSRYDGTLSFFFDDTNANSYSNEDFGQEGILAFIREHCNMPNNTNTRLAVSGGGTVGVDSSYRHTEAWVVTSLQNNYGSWYCDGLHYNKVSAFGSFDLKYYIGAYPNFIPWNGYAVLYDNVEPL